MGIFDKAREALHEHADTIDGVVDKVADQVDRRTGGEHAEHVDRGADLAKDKLREHARRGTAPERSPDAP